MQSYMKSEGLCPNNILHSYRVEDWLQDCGIILIIYSAFFTIFNVKNAPCKKYLIVQQDYKVIL